MSEGRCCCNCRHDIRVNANNNGDIQCHCDIDGHTINYVQTFEDWCHHWAKDHSFDDAAYEFEIQAARKGEE